MRPECLFAYFRSVSSLKGVGTVTLPALYRLLGEGATLRDVLFHLPSSATDRRTLYRAAEAPLDALASLQLTIEAHYPPPASKGRRKTPYRIACSDGSADVLLVFFNVASDYLKKQLPIGESRIISGRLERYDGVLQMTHPDVIARIEQREAVLKIEANYPLTYALSHKKLRSLCEQALALCPNLPEWQMPQVQAQQQWVSFRASLARLHSPHELADVQPESPFRARLAYDELLAHQLSLAVVRERTVKQQGIVIQGASAMQAQCLASLPFALTQGQQTVLVEIAADMASGNRMLRLLQGDVGSGKTIVALLALLPLLEQGYQAAFMVPTEILGKQHLHSLQQLTAPLGIKVAMLSGKLPSAERARIEAQIQSGELQLVIGTHALFQQSVAFHRLGMVIIDEQHRFGVKQRLALSSKGQHPHVLLMSATPIPRSLTMTVYGDMDCSVLYEKPAFRKAIDTRVVPLSRIHEVVDGIKRALTKGTKVYWICPLVEEPDESARPEGDLAAAEERFRVFRQVFGERVALVHGQQKPEEREQFMQGFVGNKYDVLVATTVVEVGVNVPEATIMVIEHAERFGLAQLHQLRGRVGRGAEQSSCILLYSPKCSAVAQERLKIIRESNDGFRIAEEDLSLRGAGDVLGTRQSGLPDFYFADVATHRELMRLARDDVKWILHHDAMLHTERGKALRVLLYLFGYDDALRFIHAG